MQPGREQYAARLATDLIGHVPRNIDAALKLS